VREGLVKGEENQGFDTAGKELIVHSGDHLGYRYEVLRELGRGSFG
jgi:dual specificity tyrosine-phosphorylation-regulated kinase 2/3/4